MIFILAILAGTLSAILIERYLPKISKENIPLQVRMDNYPAYRHYGNHWR